MGLLRIIALSLAMAPFAYSVDSFAQSNQRIAINESSVLNLTPNVETVFPIGIASGTELPKQSALLIQGIPPALTLTEGRVFDSGVWFVPATALPALKIVAASQASGLRTSLTMTLVALDGAVLAEGQTILAVSASGNTAATAATQGAVQAPAETKGAASKLKLSSGETTRPTQRDAANPPPSKPQTLSIPPAVEAERLKSGQAALALDDVARARLVFEYLANHGCAVVAYQLARTYDPQIHARTTVGAKFKPDAAIASKWYAKAAEMGNAEARKKIAGNR